MESHPQAFFTPRQIASFVAHLSQRRETIQLFFGPAPNPTATHRRDDREALRDFPSSSVLPNGARLSSSRNGERARLPRRPARNRPDDPSGDERTRNDANAPAEESTPLENAADAIPTRPVVLAATNSTRVDGARRRRRGSAEEYRWIARRTGANGGRFRSGPARTAEAGFSEKDGEERDGERGTAAGRPGLKFMAAPGMANKRKRQTTLRNLVIRE